ncbi:hypothetical protein A2Y85_07110 [candidate division WOR-3 bacterium RBG_13_43_14]|uniref:Uncharacterized protein n=1 Tax=candidate division WOR-3 bacterium RBG_13_43_14 TaxID=1802590 RepID=A0A1F4UCU6_UNCW3|nr:MAG: hypothetical protein A2Y85_07110 [candidate division WOR-3 bacterium RBG_13_43_14]
MVCYTTPVAQSNLRTFFKVMTPFLAPCMSEERALLDLKISKKEKKSIAKQDMENKVKDHLETLFVSVMKKGLDKGFEEPHAEFVFYKEPLVSRRVHSE